MDGKHHTLLVFFQHRIVRSIVGCPHTSVNTLGTLGSRSRTHQDGTEGRTERKGTNHGETDRGCHRHTKLRIEDTGGSTHEGYRNEHGHEDTGTRDDRHRHITHGIFRSQIGRLVTGIKLRLYRLDHHNGIIHHRTDGQHQGKQGQDIDTETGCHQTGKGSDQGDDNRNRRNQGTLEILQEEINHQDDQQNGNHQGLHHVVDRGEQEVIGTHHTDELHTLRQILAHQIQLIRNALVYLRSVGSRHLEHHKGYTRMTIRFTLERIGDGS